MPSVSNDNRKYQVRIQGLARKFCVSDVKVDVARSRRAPDKHRQQSNPSDNQQLYRNFVKDPNPKTASLEIQPVRRP